MAARPQARFRRHRPVTKSWIARRKSRYYPFLIPRGRSRASRIDPPGLRDASPFCVHAGTGQAYGLSAMSLLETSPITFVSPAVLAGDDPAANPCLDCGALFALPGLVLLRRAGGRERRPSARGTGHPAQPAARLHERHGNGRRALHLAARGNWASRASTAPSTKTAPRPAASSISGCRTARPTRIASACAWPWPAGGAAAPRRGKRSTWPAAAASRPARRRLSHSATTCRPARRRAARRCARVARILHRMAGKAGTPTGGRTPACAAGTARAMTPPLPALERIWIV